MNLVKNHYVLNKERAEDLIFTNQTDNNKEKIKPSEDRCLSMLVELHEMCSKGKPIFISNIAKKHKTTSRNTSALKELEIIKLTHKIGNRSYYCWNVEYPNVKLARKLLDHTNLKHPHIKYKTNKLQLELQTPNKPLELKNISESLKPLEDKLKCKAETIKTNEYYVFNFLWGLFSIKKVIK